MYRAVALGVLQSGASPAEVAERAGIDVGERVALDGRDVTEAIRAPEVSARASEVAADPRVRASLVRRQQEILTGGDWVAEGRDIGLIVAPEAEVKVFLFADPAERAKRRAVEQGADIDQVLRAQNERDARDQSDGRTVLEPAPDAVPVDTTALSVDEVVDQIVTLVVEAEELR
jgi:cytidylate kinase